MKLLNLKQRFPETTKYLTYQQKRLRQFGVYTQQKWTSGRKFIYRQIQGFPERWKRFRIGVAHQSSRIKNGWATLIRILRQCIHLLIRLFWFLFMLVRIVVTAILTMIGAALIAAVFVPENYELKRSITVKQSPKEVFAVLQNLEKRTQWDPWFKVDTSLITKISPTKKGGKTSLSWVGTRMKEGHLKIKQVNAPKSLQLESVSMEQYMTTLQPWQDQLPFQLDLPFVKPLTTTETWLVAKTGSTTLIMRMETGHLDYPVERWIGLLMEKDLGARFDSSLINLKTFLK